MRVLVVDDSSTHRRATSLALAKVEGVVVVGTAANGEEALAMVSALEPDAITLDLEMPRMDGFSFLRLLMSKKTLPVIVVSSRSAKPDVFRALELGALDFVVKPSATGDEYIRLLRDGLIRALEAVQHFRGARMVPAFDSSTGVLLTPKEPRMLDMTLRSAERCVLIGASTGGPPALLELFSRLEANMPVAMVVAQHMPERFTTSFAERLDRLQVMRVRETTGADPLYVGHAYVVAGGTTAVIEDTSKGPKLVAHLGGVQRYVPSIDSLFQSAAYFGARAMGVVLTGMGDDGARGAVALRDAGGVVVVESEASAAIFGMPRATLRTGAAHEAMSLEEIARAIVRFSRDEYPFNAKVPLS